MLIKHGLVFGSPLSPFISSRGLDAAVSHWRISGSFCTVAHYWEPFIKVVWREEEGIGAWWQNLCFKIISYFQSFSARYRKGDM